MTKLTQAIAEFLKNDSSHRGGGGGGGGLTQKYTVTVLYTEHGKAEVSQKEVLSGNSVTITATPDDGYVVSDMLINGKLVGNNAVYTISSVKENIEVKVIFAKKADMPFTDVSPSDWFYPYVKSAYENKFMLSTSDTKFEPETCFVSGSEPASFTRTKNSSL